MTSSPPASRTVLFDAYWWLEGPIANRTVQRELVRAWREEFPHDQVVLALRRAHRARVDDLPPGVRAVSTRAYPHGVSNMLELGRLARRLGAHLVVAHNYTPLSKVRSATFVHDVMFTEHPEWFSRRERAYFWFMLPSSRRASVVLTSTRTEAARIESRAPWTAPVGVTGLGLAPGLLDEAARPPGDAEGLDEFALCVGRLNIRKNLAGVVRGAAESRHVTPRTPLLVVGSSEFSGVDAALPDEVRALVEDGRVRFLGRVDDAELAWLYGAAAVTVFLSRDEGFGMPVLEASWFGSPLVLADIPVFREVGGRAAHYVDPDADPAVVGAVLDRAWNAPPSDEERQEVLARYGWRSAVRRLRDAVAREAGAPAHPADPADPA